VGKMGKISTHTKVVWFLLIGDTHHSISGLCSILKAFYGDEQWEIIQSGHSLQTVENAVPTSQGMVHLSSKEQLQNGLKILILLHEAKSRISYFSFYSSRRHAMKNSDAFHKNRRAKCLPDPKNGTDDKTSQL